MQDALGRDVVERLRVARRTAAVCFWNVIRRGLRRGIGQGDCAQKVSAGTRAQIMCRTPDLLGPVNRLTIVVDERTHLHDHRRRLRLVDELLFAAPTHPDRLSRSLYRDNGSVSGGVICTIVAVAAGTLHVVDHD